MGRGPPDQVTRMPGFAPASGASPKVGGSGFYFGLEADRLGGGAAATN